MEIFSIDAHRREHESVIRFPGVSGRSIGRRLCV